MANLHIIVKLMTQSGEESLAQMTDEEFDDEVWWEQWQLYSHKPVLVTLWVFSLYLIIASIIKMGYHRSQFLTSTVPESCLLITIGIGFGTVLK